MLHRFEIWSPRALDLLSKRSPSGRHRTDKQQIRKQSIAFWDTHVKSFRFRWARARR